MESSRAVYVLPVGIGLRQAELLDTAGVPLATGHAKWRLATRIGMCVRATEAQRTNDLSAALLARNVQRRRAVQCGMVCVRAKQQEFLHALEIILLHCDRQPGRVNNIVDDLVDHFVREAVLKGDDLVKGVLN